MAERSEAESFEQLLEHLRQTRGFDFSAYKRASLRRRATKRMQAVGVETFDGYLDYLELHPEEFEALFNTILINVTTFFRDPDVWAYLDSVILPQLLQERGDRTPLRVWSAGCASGQEAYSVAMLVAERYGIEAVRDRAKIYATDVDEEALKEGRRASFAARDLEGLPPAFREKYFTADGSGTSLNRDLRRAVMFGRLDLLQDAPISRIDLLLCRNTLMYFNADAQARILSRFSFSLDPNGFLVLGRAEMLFSHSAMFSPVDLQRRIFRVIAKANHRDRIGALALSGRDAMSNGSAAHLRLRFAAFEADTAPQLLVDASGTLVAISVGAREQLNLNSIDVGRPLQELEVSYRPVDLRSAIDRVAAEQRDVVLKEVHHFVGGHPRYFDVTVAPVFDDARAIIGTRIVFDDSTSFHHLQSELTASKQELETAYDELQSTNEELQSTNEELQTMNDELRTRSVDADLMNAYLESVFSSLRSGVAVLDREYRVQVWNRRAEDLWGVRGDEAIGTLFPTLEIGLPVAQLAESIRSVMNGEQALVEKTIPSLTRRGRTIDCLISITPLRSSEGSITGVIILMDEAHQGG